MAFRGQLRAGLAASSVGAETRRNRSSDRTNDLSAPRLDPLTNLPDRTLLNARLIELLGSRHRAESFAILFVDINNFKEINDRHGHLVGDRVLREAARQLSGCLESG